MRQLILFLLFLTVTTVILMEIGLRALGYNPLTIDSTVWQYHPSLGWSQAPGASEEFHRVGFEQDIEINSLGLREREIPYENERGVPRVLVIGDSQVAGFEVPMEDVFPRVAERILNERGYEVEFINAGCRGWGTDQSLIWLKEYGVRYSPDLVLYFWSPNDVDNNLTIHKSFRRFGKSYFLLNDDGSVRHEGVPVPDFDYTSSIRVGPNGEIVEEEVPARYKARLTLRDWTAGSSALAATLLHVFAQMPGIVDGLRSMGRTNAGEVSNPTDGAHPIEPDLSTEDDYGFLLSRALVAEMRAVSNAAGAEFRMMGAPRKRPVPTRIREDLALEEFWPRERFDEIKPEGATLNPPYDPHWNSEGHLYFGMALADEMIERGLVPQRK